MGNYLKNNLRVSMSRITSRLALLDALETVRQADLQLPLGHELGLTETSKYRLGEERKLLAQQMRVTANVVDDVVLDLTASVTDTARYYRALADSAEVTPSEKTRKV